ncbi:hypothetical protein GEMRC1_008563 [Eukaryota sp. GEM-RC1]
MRPLEAIDEVHSLVNYKKTNEGRLPIIPPVKEWNKRNQYPTINPPLIQKTPGRRQKKRNGVFPKKAKQARMTKADSWLAVCDQERDDVEVEEVHLVDYDDEERSIDNANEVLNGCLDEV